MEPHTHLGTLAGQVAGLTFIQESFSPGACIASTVRGHRHQLMVSWILQDLGIPVNQDQEGQEPEWLRHFTF